MEDKNAAAEAAFREAANRRAALEARLNEKQRAQYQALREKQEVALKRQEERLEKRRHEYEAEKRKHNTALTLDMIQRDRAAPRALRDAAREYASQEHWFADLKRTQERERDRFLERAVASEPAQEKFRADFDNPRSTRPRE